MPLSFLFDERGMGVWFDARLWLLLVDYILIQDDIHCLWVSPMNSGSAMYKNGSASKWTLPLHNKRNKKCTFSIGKWYTYVPKQMKVRRIQGEMIYVSHMYIWHMFFCVTLSSVLALTYIISLLNIAHY